MMRQTDQVQTKKNLAVESLKHLKKAYDFCKIIEAFNIDSTVNKNLCQFLEFSTAIILLPEDFEEEELNSMLEHILTFLHSDGTIMVTITHFSLKDGKKEEITLELNNEIKFVDWAYKFYAEYRPDFNNQHHNN